MKQCEEKAGISEEAIMPSKLTLVREQFHFCMDLTIIGLNQSYHSTWKLMTNCSCVGSL